MNIQKIFSVRLDEHELQEELLNILILPGIHTLEVTSDTKINFATEVYNILTFYMDLINNSKAPLADEILKKYYKFKTKCTFEVPQKAKISIQKKFLESLNWYDLLKSFNIVSIEESNLSCNKKVKFLALKYLSPLLLFFCIVIFAVSVFSFFLLFKSFIKEAILGFIIFLILIFVFKYLLKNSPPLYSWLILLKSKTKK